MTQFNTLDNVYTPSYFAIDRNPVWYSQNAVLTYASSFANIARCDTVSYLLATQSW